MTQPNTGHILGNFRLIRPLGRGGMGVVHLAEHTRTGELAAVKTLNSLDLILLQSFRREVQALRRIVHPGIVRILDEDINGPTPWYAMSFVDGVDLGTYAARLRDFSGAVDHETNGLDSSSPTLMTGAFSAFSTTEVAGATHFFQEPTRHLSSSDWPVENRDESPVLDRSDQTPQWATIQRLEAEHLSSEPNLLSSEPIITTVAQSSVPPTLKPAALEAILSMVCQLCHALAFLHGEALVHGDLKPANVLITSEGRPVLLDFGLSSTSSGGRGRQQLSFHQRGTGTLHYMSPEQVRSEPLDARADLYALGCLLYELLVGHPPFVSQVLQEILLQHIQMVPTPPSHRVDGIPRGLDELVMRLLEKNPRDRLGHAQDVAYRLEALGAKNLPREGERLPRAYLYQPGLVGRDQALEPCLALLQRPLKQTGALLMVAGEAGVGKTAFCTDLASRASQLGLDVAVSAAAPRASNRQETPDDPPSRGLLKPVLHLIQDQAHAEPPDRVRWLIGDRPWILSTVLPGLTRHLMPAVAPGEACSRQDLLEAMVGLLSRYARLRPLLLVVDDLQWADDFSMDLLTLLCRPERLEHLSLVVIGTHRSEESTPGIERLLALEHTQRLRLPRLGGESVRRMMAEMLAMPSPPVPFYQRVLAQSEGNPFFVVQYLHAAITEHLLYRNRRGEWRLEHASAWLESAGRTPLPGALADLIHHRVRNLPDHSHRVMEAAATLGREQDFGLLLEIAEGTEDLDGAIEELRRRHILETHGATQLRFTHHSLRDAAYARMAMTERTGFHRAAAAALERRSSGQDSADSLQEIARHWKHAEETQRAQVLYLEAAEKAMTVHVYGQAVALFTAWLRLEDAPTLKVLGTRLKLSHCLRREGQHQKAIELLEENLGEARTIGAVSIIGQTLLELAVAHRSLGHLQEAAECAEKAAQQHAACGETGLKAKALTRLSAILTRLGRLEQAQSCGMEALQLHRSEGNRTLEGETLSGLATIGLNLGAFAEAREQYEAAVQIFEELEALPQKATALTNLGSLDRATGAMATARTSFEAALEVFQRIGDRDKQGVVMNNLCSIYLNEGDPGRALETGWTALKIARDSGNRRAEAMTLGNMAMIQRLVKGDFGRAERLIRDANIIFRQVGDPIGQAMTQLEWGRIALAQARDVQPHVLEATGLIEKAGLGAASKLGQELELLRQQRENSDPPGRLFRGIPLDTLAEGLRRWLEESGQLTTPGNAPEK